MKDTDIRLLLRPLVERKFTGFLICDELSIHEGKSRIDLAVVADTGIHGFEIKSRVDNIKRLKGNQSERMSRVCETATLVVDPAHLWKADGVIPSWWGITCLEFDYNDKPSLMVERHPKPNPNVSAVDVARCFWKEEILSILGNNEPFKSMNKKQLYEIMGNSFPLPTLYQLLDIRLRKRMVRDNRWAAMHGIDHGLDE